MDDFKLRENLRVEVYRLFALLFQYDFEESILEELALLLSHISEEAYEWLQKSREAYNKVLSTEIGHEYLRLFVGPGPLIAPLYESCYTNPHRRLMTEETFDVLNYYKQVGVNKLNDFKEPPDHIRVELDFMSILIDKTLQSVISQDFTLAKNYLSLQKIFLEKHLCNWIPLLTHKIADQSANNFYGFLSKSLSAFLNQELNEDILAVAQEVNEISSRY